MKKVIIITALIIGLSILGYGLMNYSYKIKVLNQDRLEKINNGVMCEDCIDSAHKGYLSNWSSECIARGLKSDCSLPKWNAERLDELKERNIDNCIKVYPAK